MLKAILLTLLLASALGVKSQVLIDSALSRYPVGLNTTFEVLTEVDPLPNYPKVGSNLLWDFSNLVFDADITRLESVVEASTTPNGSAFPMANLCVQSRFSIQADTNFDYYRETTMGLELLGTVRNVNMNFSFCTNPQLEWRYPFSIGDTLFDTSDCGSGTDTLLRIYSGFGELRLPRETVTNCMLITEVGPLDTVYQWYDTDPRLRLVAFQYTNLFEGYEYPDFITDIGELPQAKNAWQLLPNPGFDVVRLKYESATKVVDLVVSNLNGQTIFSDRFTRQAGMAYELQVSEWAPGVYWVNLQSPEANETLKLVVR